MAASNKWTMLDLVQMVSETAQTDAEIVAMVAALVNSNTVQLCGNFAGAKIEGISLSSSGCDSLSESFSLAEAAILRRERQTASAAPSA